MNFILFDQASVKENLLPLTYFRPIAAIRCGIFTLQEKWENYLQTPVSILSESYLQEKFPVSYQPDNIYINSAVLPSNDLVAQISTLEPGQALWKNTLLIAIRSGKIHWEALQTITGYKVFYTGTLDILNNVTDIFRLNAIQIKKDFYQIIQDKQSKSLSATNIKLGKYPVFLESGAKVEACVFNTEEGPVYIGNDVKILEGSLIRGPFAALDKSVVKMGAKIYGGTTLGPYTKVGGEIKDVVFFGNANKGHDGYLGDSVIAEWCNLGADTNNSNLKNNYSKVKLWNYPANDFVDSGLQFCGLIMGDHSKSGIATMFNTGTVVGVNSNVFGADYQPKFFPSFKWGGKKYVDYHYDKALSVAKAVMKRRHKDFDATEQNLFKKVYNLVKEKEAGM